MSWKKVCVKDVALGIFDGPHATPPESDSGAIFLGIPNFVNGQLDLTEIRYISEDDLPKWTKRVTPQENDIVFSYEATLNLYAIIPKDFRGCLGRRMALIRPDTTKINYKFLYYYFYSKAWRDVISENIVLGATVDRIPLVKFPDFQIELPDMRVQNKIADILSTYDSLIKNNQKQIKLLEEAAQRLYKEWFVDLRFPGHENTSIIDGIMQGWKVIEIGTAFKTLLGGTPSREKAEYWENGTVPWINSGKVNELRVVEPSEYITDIALNRSATKLLPKHTTLVAITGATLGQVSYTEIETCANQSVVGIVDESQQYSEYVYCYVLNNIKNIIGKATGGAQQHINKDIVNSYPIILPNDDIAVNFQSVAKPIFDKISKLLFENINLTEARDRLLPKLMSGELEV